MRSVDSRAPCGSSGSFGGFGPFPRTLGSSASFGCVRYIPVRPGGRRELWVHSRAHCGSSCSTFGQFPCALGVERCACALGSSGSLLSFPCALGDVGFVGERSFGPFLCAMVVVGFFRVRSSIPVRPRDLRFRSCAFGPLPFALGFVQVRSVYSPPLFVMLVCVRSIPERHGGDRDRSGAFGQFPGGNRVRSVDSRPLWGLSASFDSVRSIPLCPWCHRVRSANSSALWGSSGSLVCVRSIPVRPVGRRVRSCTFGPFPCAMGVIGYVHVRSIHSRAHWGSSSFVCVRSIPVRLGVRSGTLSPFPCALGDRSVDSRSP